MEMFRQNTKSYINYSSEDFMDTTAQDLVRMTPEETICRCHYRMERGLDHCTPEEKQYRMQQFARVMERNFPGQACEPYAMTEEAVGMTGSIAVLKRSRYFPSILYTHKNFEMFYIYSGSCIHICKGQEYELQQGDFCLLEHGAPHRILNNTDDCIIIELLVQRELLDQICTSLLSTNTVLSRFFKNALYGQSNYPMIVFHTGNNRAVQYYTYAMYSEFKSKLPHSQVMLEAFLNALFVILLRYFQPQQEQPKNLENSSISIIVEYIYEHEQDITLGSLAQAFGYSVPHMSKLISSSCGISFSDILRQIRMRRATWLLKHTSLTITQIAAEVHCTDTSHFGKNFRKEFHMSPKEYRQLFATLQPDN